MNSRKLFPVLTDDCCRVRRTLKWPLMIGATLLAVAAANAAEIVWIGGTGEWNAAGNWSPAQVPGPADNVFITNSGSYTVLIDKPDVDPTVVSSLTLGGDVGIQTLSVGNVVLTLNGASVVNPNGTLHLTLNSSELTGPGTVTVNGALNWAGGTIGGPGVTSIGSGGVLAISGGVTLLTRTLNIEEIAIANWNSGNLNIDTGAVINNLAGGTFNIGFDGNASSGGIGGGVFNNAGLLQKTDGALTAKVVVQFNNTGTVDVRSGTLSLDDGGIHTGNFSTVGGAVAMFGGGNHELAGESFVTGVLSLSGGTLNVSGNFDAGTTLNVISGTATLAASCNVTATSVNISGTGGTVVYNSSGTVGTVNVTAGTLAGTSPVTVTGLLTLAGGTVSNPLVTANGGLDISGGVTLNGGKVINPGTAIWSAGNLTGANGAVFSNLLGATFINTFDGNAPSGAGAIPTFVNAGLFQKTNGTVALGTTSIDFQFINTGTVEVQTNTLRYATNRQTAGLTLLNGGGLTAQAQPIQLLGGSLVGTGLVTVANVQKVINSAVVSPGLPLGRMDIAGNYQQTASGVLNIELGGYSPGTDFDLVTVTAGGGGGVATLGGTLNVTLANGFSPTNGATFSFLTANSRVGAFATFSYPSNDIGMQVSYDLTSAKVSVSNLKPVVANPIVDPAPVAYGATFNFQFPANTFSDPDNNALSFTASGMPPGITFAGATRTFSGTPTQAGVYPVKVVANDGGTPNLMATNTFTLTVNPATLTITAQSQIKFYGATDPVLTYTVGGLQFTDTPVSVLTGALTRAPGESATASPYAITQGTLVANSNYTISFTGDTLTINKASLSVTAEAKTKTYGATDPAFTVTYGGFVNSETPAVLGGTLGFARASGEVVGNYMITAGGLTSDNYAITFNTGNLTITTAALTVTAAAKTKTYGVADPALIFTVSGLQFSDTAAVVLTGALDRAAGETVSGSPYAITEGTLTPNRNYTISFTGSTLTINKASLSVTADAKTKTYGATDPAFTVTCGGFVNSETTAALSGALAFTRAPGENVGDYLITPAGLTSGNYTIAFNTGNLSITKAALSVTANDKFKTYGAIDPALTVTYAGFVNSDTPIVLGGTLVFTRAPGENVGDYLITPAGLTSGNYTIAFNTGNLSITKAALSVTADDKTKTYGTADPAFTATYAGFVNSETWAVLGGTLGFARAPGESVGSYLITPNGLTSGNYAIAFNTGNLSITKAVLTVAADPINKTYGALDPELTFTVTGLKFSETPASTLTGTLTRIAGETVASGPYAITQGTLTPNGNYTLSFTSSTLTITKASLSVTADAKTKIYGAADPAFTVTYAGLANGETATVLTGTLTFSRASGENVGSYSITPSGLTSGNYAIAFNIGNLSITKAVLSVAADPLIKTYGTLDPALTFTVTGLKFSDTPASVLTGVLTRVSGETVSGSPYTITQGTLTPDSNYTISFTGNALTINKAPLSVTADAKTKTHGAADPAFTATYAGFVNSETPAVLGGTLALTRVAGENVGNYLITPSGLTSGNYAISFNAGTMTIVAPAPLILPLIRTNTTNILITWTAVSNANYRVQYKSDLHATDWNDLIGDITANADTAVKADTLTTTNRFYRIQILP